MAYAVEEQARRRTTVALAIGAGVLAVVVALVVVLVVRGGGEQGEPAGRRGDEGGPGAAEPGGNTPRPAAEVLNADTVVWQDLFGIPLPTGPPGPRDIAGNRTAGFEQSPAGAVLAAINTSYRASADVGPEVFAPTMTEQVVGDDADVWLANVRQSYETERSAGRQAGSDGELVDALAEAIREDSQVWAYRLDAYDPALASVQMLGRAVPIGQSQPIFVNLALTVQWVEGDWRLVAPPGGDFTSVASQLSEVPDGYVLLGEARS